MLALVLAAGALAWGLMILHRGYTYDEVLRTHSVWMTSQGLRPYHDFFECHPPYFALLAPLARGLKDPAALLVALRLVALAGNLLFLAGLAAALAGPPGVLAAILGTALVAFHPAVLAFLAEFRIDGWGYALAIWSIVWFLRSRRSWRGAGLGAGTGIATLFLCPKVALLPPLVLAFERLRARSSWRDALWAGATYGIGIAAAGGLFWVWLAANRLGAGQVFALLVSYNSLSNFHSSYGHGLWREIGGWPTLGVPILAAAAAGAVSCIRARTLPAAYPAALALWLAAQAALVSFPHAQYYGPWFLFASGLFPFLYPWLKTFPGRAAARMFFGVCALSVAVSLVNAPWMDSRESRDDGAIRRTINEVTDPDDYIVAMPPFHPIDRRDTFFAWFDTFDPAGHETEEILQGLPLVRGLVSEQRYRDELQAHPPALVVLWSDSAGRKYPRRQQALLEQFLQERRYVVFEIGDVPVAVRPDRFERLARLRPQLLYLGNFRPRG
ncbi:MAG: hypothetical protein NTY77_09605 [Elusimicrobia bacterium]|nr:hypothetical protein [Elusimicrobiota bacterium]